MTSLRDLVLRSRSYRRFDESHPVSRETLVELLETARATPSAANRQPLKYVLSHTPKTNAEIFPHLAWAGYLEDWPGPAPGERPAAYIAIAVDRTIAKDWWCDDGIVAQTVLLGAVERGLGGCMIGAFHRKKLSATLNLAEHLHLRLVLALGRPAETVVLEDIGANGDIRYWRDEHDVHHVPKRTLEELILN